MTESYGMKDTWRSWGLHIVREDKTINKEEKKGGGEEQSSSIV